MAEILWAFSKADHSAMARAGLMPKPVAPGASKWRRADVAEWIRTLLFETNVAKELMTATI